MLQALLAESIAERARAAGSAARLVAAADASVGPAADGQRDDSLVIRASVAGIGLTGHGIDPPLELVLRARAGIDGAADAKDEAFDVRIGQRRLAQWIEHDASGFAQTLQTAYRRLGAHIYEQLVLLYDPPGSVLGSAGVLAGAFGLAPEYPRMTATTATGTPVIAKLAGEWPAVDPQPTLRWQSFPRPEHLQATPGLADRLGDVRYDLVIARAEALGPAEVVYERSGLAEPAHRINVPLERGRRYFWTVRPHFRLDGRERVGEWGTTSSFARRTLAVPNVFSYRFAIRR